MHEITNTLETTLTWAVPVRIDKAGAHLKAYIDTLPTIIALRLCNQFGSGSQCHVNKLPVELVSAIETLVVDAARAETLDIWSTEYKCYEVKCDTVDDHFTHEQQHKMYHQKVDYKCRGSSHCPFQRNVDAETAAEHHEAVADFVRDQGCWWRPHDNRRHSWMSKVDTDSLRCIFNEHQTLIRSHFGIEIWTSNVRLPPLKEGEDGPDWFRFTEGRSTTVAYMTLPNKVVSREDWSSNDLDSGDVQSGYAMPVNLSAAPKQKSLRRFKRAMNLLGLEVFSHATQKGTVISAPTDVHSSSIDDGTDGWAANSPQLTLLTRSRVQRK